MKPDSHLDAELARLARVDLDPFAARALRVKATRRLTAGRARSRLERIEARLLLGLATTHLVWAVLRVYELSGR